MKTPMCFRLVFIFGLLTIACTEAVLIEDTDPINDPVTYNGEIKSIFDTHCVSCHGGSNPQAGVDISTYQGARFFSEEGRLIERINDPVNPMPPSGLLPNMDIQLIEAWVDDGFLEN